MATCVIRIDATPERVFSLLADAKSFAYWVVGAKRIRAVEGDWPEVGSAFHHTVGVGPVKIRDHTKVIECERPAKLVLEAVARPLGSALVSFELRADGGGTWLRMEERPIKGPATRLPRALVEPMTRARNDRSLLRLKRAVEARPGSGPASD